MTERELFEQKLSELYPSTSLDKYPDGTYWHERAQMSWDMWQASANRQGYKLVPVEPTDIELDAIKEAHWDMRGCQLCRSDYNDLYKAMIGAVE